MPLQALPRSFKRLNVGHSRVLSESADSLAFFIGTLLPPGIDLVAGLKTVARASLPSLLHCHEELRSRKRGWDEVIKLMKIMNKVAKRNKALINENQSLRRELLMLRLSSAKK